MCPEDIASYTAGVNPAQLRKLLQKSGLTQTEAARLIGLTDRTMRRYVSGETKVPRVVICALLYVIHVQEELERESIEEVFRRHMQRRTAVSP